ncbi:MAG: glycosyltransferase family 4 protein [Candidatus Entotheonellia bacterium]
MLLSNAQPSVGGTERQALSLANALRSRGICVAIVSKRQKGLQGSTPADGDGRLRIIPLPILRRHPGWSFLFVFLAWACLHRRRFHIIHAHTLPLGVIACLVGWLLRKKVIVKIPSLKNVAYLKGGPFLGQLRRWIVLGKADRFIAVSGEMAQALRSSDIQAPEICLIPNGIELARITSPEDPTALKRALLGHAATQVVLFVGRLVIEKGLDRLLNVWASLPNRESATLLIVGDGPLRGTLEARARALALLPSVRFLGHQSDVAQLYSIADLFVLPSTTEGMSNALLEAMAAGLPAVASDVGGNKEVIQDRMSGFLVDWDNTTACAQLLATLLSDPPLRQCMGEMAKKRALTFAMAGVAERYQQLYQAVLQQRPFNVRRATFDVEP